MSRRFPRIAAPLALTLITATQAFGYTFDGLMDGTPIYPQFLDARYPTCYTRIYSVTPTGTTSRQFARTCDTGERAGSIKVNYRG